jgi:NitT/TauT family transport system substrate-binding protein
VGAMDGIDAITRRMLLGGVAAAALTSSATSFGKSPDRINVCLEFRIDGANAPVFLAQQSIYAKYGLEITPEGSAGSDEAVRRVAAGMYKFGYADASNLVAFAGSNPKLAPKILLPIFDRFPACIVSLRKNSVNSIDDLKKARIGSGTSDAGAKLFPVLMALNNINPKSLNITTVDVKLRDAMLLTGRVDAVIAFDYTSVFNLVGNGVPLADINIFYFSDMGFGMFGNSLIAHPDVIAAEPDLVKRVVAACADAWIYGHSHRQEAADAVVKREKLLNPTIEFERLSWVYDKDILTPNVKKNGLGTVDLSRMKTAIGLIKEGFDLEHVPAISDVYDDSFLPQLKDRTFA